MTITNYFCSFNSTFHKGKIEWHHPSSLHPNVGFHLCEAHHSLIKDRKVRYRGELSSNLSLKDMAAEIYLLEYHTFINAGLDPSLIDKH